MDVRRVKWRLIFIMAIITQIIALLFERKRDLPLGTLMAFVTVFDGLMGIKPEDLFLFTAMRTVAGDAMVTGQGIIFMCPGNNICFVAVKADAVFRFFEQIGKIGYVREMTGLAVSGRLVDEFLPEFF